MEVDQNKAKAIISAKAPQNKKELQKFLGQVNYLRRFISNLVGKTKVFSNLIKLKEMEECKWDEQHQITFDGIKGYLSKPPVLMPPLRGRLLKLYLSAAKESIGCLLARAYNSGVSIGLVRSMPDLLRAIILLAQPNLIPGQLASLALCVKKKKKLLFNKSFFFYVFFFLISVLFEFLVKKFQRAQEQRNKFQSSFGNLSN